MTLEDDAVCIPRSAPAEEDDAFRSDQSPKKVRREVLDEDGEDMSISRWDAQ